MTFDEAQNLAHECEKLNIDYMFEHNRAARTAIKQKIVDISRKVFENGYQIKRAQDSCPAKPHFCVVDINNIENLSLSNNRPKNVNVKRDCTTRCVSFCTGVDYNVIRKEQLETAKKEHTCWRMRTVWSKSLFKRGFKEIDLPRKVTRATFIRLFKDSGIDDGIIATLSSRHVAALDMKTKKVLDTWNSTGGRIYKIYVPESQYDIYSRKVNAILG